MRQYASGQVDPEASKLPLLNKRSLANNIAEPRVFEIV